MDPLTAALLVLAGALAGLTGSVAGLASLISYPSLLAAGLPPIAANVTNTVALMSTTVGAAAGSRPELRGQGRRLVRLGALAAVGGSLGALLLLSTPAATFELVVPWLIALGAAALLARDRLRGLAGRWVRPPAGSAPAPTRIPLPFAGVVVAIGLYGGYFGAAAGILMLAAISVAAHEPLPVSNAVKNVVTGAANGVAALAYVFLAPVSWGAAAALAVGCLVGSWIGPAVVRRLPDRPLRVGIALAGFGLALYLWVSAVQQHLL